MEIGDDFNIKAEADPSGLRARLEARFQVGDIKIKTVLGNVEKSVDAYMLLRLGKMSNQPIDHVIKKYKAGKGKGWGALAKSLGIKPGSAEIRLQNDKETWITGNMINAYCKLHESGYAHSVETWMDGELVGGLYGVATGRCFFGESMFTLISNASKVAFVKLVEFLQEASYNMIDCQVSTEHLINFGARHIPRSHFIDHLNKYTAAGKKPGKWDKIFNIKSI